MRKEEEGSLYAISTVTRDICLLWSSPRTLTPIAKGLVVATSFNVLNMLRLEFERLTLYLRV